MAIGATSRRWPSRRANITPMSSRVTVHPSASARACNHWRTFKSWSVSVSRQMPPLAVPPIAAVSMSVPHSRAPSVFRLRMGNRERSLWPYNPARRWRAWHRGEGIVHHLLRVLSRLTPLSKGQARPGCRTQRCKDEQALHKAPPGQGDRPDQHHTWRRHDRHAVVRHRLEVPGSLGDGAPRCRPEQRQSRAAVRGERRTHHRRGRQGPAVRAPAHPGARRTGGFSPRRIEPGNHERHDPLDRDHRCHRHPARRKQRGAAAPADRPQRSRALPGPPRQHQGRAVRRPADRRTRIGKMADPAVPTVLQQGRLICRRPGGLARPRAFHPILPIDQTRPQRLVLPLRARRRRARNRRRGRPGAVPACPGHLRHAPARRDPPASGRHVRRAGQRGRRQPAGDVPADPWASPGRQHERDRSAGLRRRAART